MSRRLVIPILGAALALAVPPAALALPRACSPDARLAAFSDELNKTTFAGAEVGGLSALALRSPVGLNRARALTDNQGTTAARFFDLTLRRGDGLHPAVTGVTTLTRSNGVPYTGADFDGEGLVSLPDGSLLASSETEPSIRHFSASGRELGTLPVPARFRVAPDGEATRNLTLEGLGLSPDGHDLFAAMEGPLTGDGSTPAGRGRVRILHFKRAGGTFALVGQVGYVADPGLGVSEVQVVGDGRLAVLERGFVAGVGNTVRVYQAFLDGASDVSSVASLADPSVAFARKRLVVDLADCPPGGATSPGTQTNPLLDNVEGMALGRPRAGDRRSLLLLSDDNFGATQVTRVYELLARFPGEPTLIGRSRYAADRLQPGPSSGNVGVDPANGQTPPFPGQPIPGISAAVANRDGTFWGQPDNGFGAKGNSADFLLRIYRFAPNLRTAQGGSGRLAVRNFITLRDPGHRIPFPIVHDNTTSRELTGGDFDIEALQRTPDGTFWIGDEFGPFLLHVDRTGKVLEAPVPLPGRKAPQNPTLAAGEVPTVRSSRGFEAVALSGDGHTLYPIVEASLTTDPDPTTRHVYEFDLASRSYTGREWTFHADTDDAQIGDAQVVAGRRILFIERDDLEGSAARLKDVDEIDLDHAPAGDGTQPVRHVFDVLHVRDPARLSTATGPAGAFGLGDPFSFPIQSFETLALLPGGKVLIANDNNYPDSSARVLGVPDDVEFDLLSVPALAR